MTTNIVQEIATQQAPAAVGPYSQAVRCGNLIFISGQLGLDPKTGDFVSAVTAEQARQALKNIQAVLESVGGTMDNVVKVTVFVPGVKVPPLLVQSPAISILPPGA